MKNLLRQLAEKVAWAEAHDEESVPGVLAVPGPRAHGDVAASEPLLGVDYDDLMARVSSIPSEPAALAVITDADDVEPSGEEN
jgi:hypothetical protein